MDPKIISYGKQTITKNDIFAVEKTLESDYLTCGPKIKEFEEKFATYVGAKYAVAVSSGTAALHLACLATELKTGEELITSPMTFAASANCALYCQAKPLFADIDENGLINPEEIKKYISSRTKIIIPVHYAGLPCNLEQIHQIAITNNLTVIEDACHALGAKYKESRIGNCKYSDMTCFSFHPVKHITTGEGGMITTNSKIFYEKLIMLRTHGITKDPEKLINNNEGPWYHEMQELGFNYRITDFQCALGISQLEQVDTFIEKRREIAKNYTSFLSNNRNIQLLLENKSQFNSYHLYVINVKDKKIRFDLFNYLKENNIFAQVHYIPVYLHPYYQKLGYQPGICPNAERFYEGIISLPLYPTLQKEEQEFVISTINQFFEITDRKKRIIDGKQINLRILTEKDATKEYCSWLNDPEVNQYLETRKTSIPELKDYIHVREKNRNTFFWGIFTKKDNIHIGNIKLEPIDFQTKTGELGLLIGNKQFWGKGYGTEATELIVEFAFKVLNLNKISLGVISENKKAIRVYEKVGFKLDEIKKESIIHNHQKYDCYKMSISRNEVNQK